VFQLEERAMLSTTVALGSAHGSSTAAARVIGSRSAGHSASRTARQDTAAPSLTPIERLGYYDPTTNEVEPLVDVMNNLNLQNKDVTVLVHGFAPGYRDWVNRYAKHTGQVLEWWQTIPSNYPLGKKDPGYKAVIKWAGTKPGDTTEPESPWLLDGHQEGTSGKNKTPIVEAQAGIAWDLTHYGNPDKDAAINRNAVVLAYSWLDNSATSGAVDSLGIPTQGYRSEAKTELNGERLAAALEQVLGPQFNGKLQLLGHSHGSKVATVAADALTHAPTPILVNQLTLLDSPETDGTDGVGAALASFGDANDNWYFLPDLNINSDYVDNPDSTFVDNYWSLFGERYDSIAYPDANSDLSQIVDVELYPANYPVTNPGRHTYPAYWYAGSSEKSLTNGFNGFGMQWSPLQPGATPPTSLSYEQDWQYVQGQAPEPQYQFDLTVPDFPSDTDTPIIRPVVLKPVTFSPAAASLNNTDQGASVTLTQNGGKQKSFTAKFTSADTGQNGLRGLLFDYQFKNFAQGDQLNIYIETVKNGKINDQLAFVMDPYLIQSAAQPASNGSQPIPQKGTISIGDAFGNTTHRLKFTLTSAQPNSSSSVTVSNLSQYAYA
jgi:hypothetical protein